MTIQAKPNPNFNAYHFVGATLRNGEPVPENGVTLRWDGPLALCRSGFHASRTAWQALDYASGGILCRVLCAGELIEGDDKLVCRERTIVARIDATDLMRQHACGSALSVIHLWDAPEVVREYLTSGDEALRVAARGAAWNAAMSAAWNSARGAARDAAWNAARNAAWGAARDAAWDAARSAASVAAGAAAGDVVWAAERAAAERRFAEMVDHAFKETQT